MKLLLGISGACSVIAMLLGSYSQEVHIPVPEKPLTNSVLISKTGSGKGSVRIDPYYSASSDSISFSIPEGSVIKLIAEPDSDSEFYGWSGACRGRSRECIVIVGTHSHISAKFLSR